MRFVILALLFRQVICGSVLFVGPGVFDTHWLYRSLCKNLSLRGHHVTAITADPINDEELTNLNEIDVSYLNIKLQKQHETYRRDSREIHACGRFELKASYTSSVSEAVFSHSKVRIFLEKTNSYDVCIIDLQYPAMLGFAAKFKCAIIGIYTSKDNIFVESAIGDNAQIFFHNLNEFIKRDMTLWERIKRTADHLHSKIQLNFKLLPMEEAIAKKHLGIDVNLKNLAHNVSLVLSNVHPILEENHPNMLAVRKVGGSNKREFNFLPRGIQIFLNYTQRGIVYFGLDTIKSVDLPNSTIKMLTEAFSKLPYEVIWKWEKKTLEDHPTNVYVTDWVPQYEMFFHPNIKLFITQGTISSIEDAINRHIPIIGIPIDEEDEVVLDECVKRGFGKKLDFKTLSAKVLIETIMEVIKNPKYKENVVRYEKLIHDKPEDDLDVAIWWTEYVMRHKRDKLYNQVEFHWYQYLLMDIILFIISVVLTVLCLLFLICKYVILAAIKYLYKSVFRKTDTSKNKSD